MSASTRQKSRELFDTPTRIALLEQDADHAEERDKVLNERFDKLETMIKGILVTLATASILLAINIAVQIKP